MKRIIPTLLAAAMLALCVPAFAEDIVLPGD